MSNIGKEAFAKLCALSLFLDFVILIFVFITLECLRCIYVVIVWCCYFAVKNNYHKLQVITWTSILPPVLSFYSTKLAQIGKLTFYDLMT